MQVPVRLRRRAEPEAPTALLLLEDGFERLAAVCGALHGRDWPAIHPVQGGFLIVPREMSVIPAGTVKLRRLSGDLYLPADARLLPALLADEMVGLTRDRGLILLPGGQVLAFDPGRPLRPEQWLRLPRVRHHDWQPLPAPPARPDRLRAIERPASPAAIIDILGGGKPDESDPLPGQGETGDDVAEDARPPAAGSTLDRLTAGMKLGVGRGLTWLGRSLGVPGLARKGADLARRAIEQVPRLSEKVLGAQESALREVLRQLRQGDIERGLRHAPPAVADPDQPTRVDGSSRLGPRTPRYSLRDLIGHGGVGSSWLGGGDVWAQLADEYRRLAREASARGDYRRAAYLYGVLLRDLRSAANELLSGGLFRDAALLFRDRLKDPAAAAAAFERAGDFDEAVRLYERSEEWDKAGDLLRRVGNEKAAIEKYTHAAGLHAARGHFLKAGDLMRTKAREFHLARDYYRKGWLSNTAEAVTCGQHLLDDRLMAEDWDGLTALLDEAEQKLAPPHTRDASRFMNYAVELSENLIPKQRHADLVDRVRLFFAEHIRSGVIVSAAAGRARELFAPETPWAQPIVRDALFAAQSLRSEPPAAETKSVADSPFWLAHGKVEAVAVARETGDIVVATETAVVIWQVAEGRVLPIFGPREQTLGVSVDPGGRVVYVLFGQEGKAILRCWWVTRGGTGSIIPQGQKDFGPLGDSQYWYLPPTSQIVGGDGEVTVYSPSSSERLVGAGLHSSPGSSTGAGCSTHLFVQTETGDSWEWIGCRMRVVMPLEGFEPVTLAVPWLPSFESDRPRIPNVDWITTSHATLEIVGLDREGVLNWSSVSAVDGTQCRSLHASHPDRYTVACFFGPTVIAAATSRNEIVWLRITLNSLLRVGRTILVSVPASVVALAARPQANEVVAVLKDGTAVGCPGSEEGVFTSTKNERGDTDPEPGQRQESARFFCQSGTTPHGQNRGIPSPARRNPAADLAPPPPVMPQ